MLHYEVIMLFNFSSGKEENAGRAYHNLRRSSQNKRQGRTPYVEVISVCPFASTQYQGPNRWIDFLKFNIGHSH
jgi:hypothetical protein